MTLLLVPLVIIFAVIILGGMWYNKGMEQKIGPKDVFLHLLGIATLYASAIAFATLIFQYIDYWFPEMARGAYYYQEGLTSAMRFAISTLIVVFPVYYFTSRLLRKMYEADPERKNIPIRKWLSYFTIFLAGGIAIGWLVATINQFLEGNFTTAFLLKALTIFFVTGSVFYYYRAVTRGEENSLRVRYFAYGIAVVVLAAVIAAFFLVGSPSERRAQKQDSQRTADLRDIQYRIGAYYGAKRKLPAKITDLNDPFLNVAIPRDPVTGTDYEYIPGEGLSFQICANFATSWYANGAQAMPPSPKIMPTESAIYGYYGPGGENWQHSSGRQCFERVIDPAFFPTSTPAKY